MSYGEIANRGSRIPKAGASVVRVYTTAEDGCERGRASLWSLTRPAGLGYTPRVRPGAKNDTCEHHSQTIHSVKDPVLTQVEPPFSGVPRTLPHSEPRMGLEWISEKVDQLLLEQPLLGSTKSEELLFR
jgi:hypothetical protein